MDYCTRADIESLFGADNVAKWADLDSDQDATKITARITKAIIYAQADLDSRLMGGPYIVPFTTAHAVITDLTARLAAIWLYKAHGTTDTTSDEGKTRMTAEKAEVSKTIKELLSGQRRVDLPRSCLASGPIVISQPAPRHPRRDSWMGRL
jgi:phage gp36-like protein